MSTHCPKCQTVNPPDSKFCSSCGLQFDSMDKTPVSQTETLKTPTEKLTRGTLFADRYEIIDELGKGGMGKVYRVEDTKIKQEIALKLIKPDIASDKKTIERFKNELKTTRNIRHKNVCGMYDLGEDKGTHFITMEYVTGGDLRKLIRQTKQLTVGTAISIAKQICDGLAEAHSLGVVHRDLKPNNIMIDDNGNARIMDFGIARTLKGKGITGSGIMIGTPEYMSPEQVEGKEVDLRSDIYSLGIILYEMLTGRVPFEGDTPFTIGVKHKSEIPKDPKDLNTQIPDNLSRLILRCLEKDKRKRYASSEELRIELENIQKGLPTTERISPAKKKPTSKEVTFTFQKRWVFVTGFLIFAAAAVLTYFILKGGKNIIPTEKKGLVVLPFTNLGSIEDNYLANGITLQITNRLNHILELSIKANASAVQCKDDTIAQIRDKLDVDYVVIGSILRDTKFGDNGQINVSWEVIETSNEQQADSDNFEIPFEDISGVQGQVAERIVRALDLKLLEPEREALIARQTDNPEAFDFYLRGEESFYGSNIYTNLEENEAVVDLYKKAVELDPEFVSAWSMLSYVQSLMYSINIDRSQERLENSYFAIQKALALDPDNPEVKLHLAYYYFYGFQDYERALGIYEDILKSRPNISRNLQGRIYAELGEFEKAIEAQKIQIEHNPLMPSLPLEIGMYCSRLRRYEEAENWYNRSIALRPKDVTPHFSKMFNSFTWKGHTEEARIYIRQPPPHPLLNWAQIWLDFLDRRYDEALSQLDHLETDDIEFLTVYNSKNFFSALIYHIQGNTTLRNTYAEMACESLEDLTYRHPENPNYHGVLGQVYALLGQKEEALKENQTAINLRPLSKSAKEGPDYLLQLVQTQILVGHYEEAMDNLEILLSFPAGMSISVPLLQLDPRYDPLRDFPRFQSLLAKYSD